MPVMRGGSLEVWECLVGLWLAGAGAEIRLFGPTGLPACLLEVRPVGVCVGNGPVENGCDGAVWVNEHCGWDAQHDLVAINERTGHVRQPESWRRYP